MVFGNSTSENGHALAASFSPPTDTTKIYWQNNTPAPSDPSATAPSDVVAGGQGLSARRLLPRTPNGDAYGGQLTFTMAVDPVKQNYFTVKAWGSDPGSGNLILNCNGKEIGNRHGGGGLNEDPLLFVGTGWYANRFFYRTEPLPLSMTHGRNSVTITIRSLGSIYDYAPIFTYVPQYQHLMNAPSLGVYTAYTHAGSVPDVSGETMGTAPTVPTPRTLENETTSLTTVQNDVNSSFASYLNAAGPGISTSNASFLAQCYDASVNAGATYITYPSGKSSADVGNQIIAAIDALVTQYGADPTAATNGWGGALGDLGDAIRLSWPLISSSMPATVAYGGTVGTVTRQAGLSAALRASIDSGRYNRRTIANQDLSCSWTIYRANRALLLVDSANALTESEAVRYFKEAAGIQPWLGNDQTGGGPTPIRGTAPYGPNWYMCTSKGTTKDGDGFVGSDYGEQGPFVYRMGLLSGDSQILARGLVLTRARCQFRYPGIDNNGYLIMMGTDPIGDRNNDLPSHYAYLGRGFGDDFLMASQGASVIGDDLLGYFQQAINDGQMLRNFTTDPYLPGRWAAIKAIPQTNVKLPSTPGQPDFAWVDEENMVVAAKHGEERFYANLYWRAPAFINGLAKVFHLTPSTAHLADVLIDDVRFRPTGTNIVTGPAVDTFTAPPDSPVEAFSGLGLPIAWRSDLTTVPTTNRDAGRGTGYTFRYGNWLVGINADYRATYNVQMPSDFTSATDLTSGQTMSGQVTLAPKTSVVFYLPTSFDPNPPPARCLVVNATGGNGSNTLGWYAAGAASSYNVLRATATGGPYTAIASGVTALNYTDIAVTNGTTYYYVLQSINAAGVTSGYSPEASATSTAPQTAGLPAPWADTDIGTSAGGSAKAVSGTFTLKSGYGDIWSTADGCHFAYQALVGDGIVTTRVTGQSSTNGNAKSGLMIRASLSAGSQQASVFLQANKNAGFNDRNSLGGGTTSQGGVAVTTPPVWLRLARTGGKITGYVSTDGATWTQVGTYTFSNGLPYVAYVGLVTSPANGGSTQTNTATFDNVSFPAGAAAAPAAPAGLAASGAPTSAVLSWTATPGAASYNVKRAATAGGAFVTVATGVALNSFTDFGLSSGSYYYAVSAVNTLGESANSTVVNVQVGGTLPGALTGLSASVSSGQVALTWNASSGASSYQVTRTVINGTATVIASGLTTNSYTDPTPVDGTVYEYGVIPVNANGTGQGAAIVVTPPGGLPPGWQGQDIGQQQTGGSTYTRGTYTIYGGGSTIFRTADMFRYAYQTVTGNFVFTARVASVQVNSTNNYQVGIMVRNTVDAGSAEVSIVTTANGSFSTYGRLSTGANTNYGGGGGYPNPAWLRMVRVGSVVYLYISTDGATWNSAGSYTASLNTALTVGLAVASESGSVQDVATFDNVSLYQNVATGGTATASSQNTAGGEGAAQAFDGSVSTKWYANNGGSSAFLRYQFGSGASQTVTQYQLTSASDVPQRDPGNWQFQGSPDGTTWTTLDTQTGQVFANRGQAKSYVVASPQAFPYYRLNVTANAGGTGYGVQLAELAFLNPSPAGPILPPVAPASLSAVWSAGQIVLNWPSTMTATSYNLKRATSSGGPYAPIGPGLTTLGYTDTGLTNGTSYYYVVTAVNPGGESPNSPEDGATPIGVPAAPAGVAVTAANAQAVLSWNAVASATSYRVKRATVSGGPYGNIAVTTTPAYPDNSVANNTTYFYVVSAVNIGGESANSAEASVTPTARLTGTVIGTTGSGNDSGNTRDKAFDGNLTTFFDAPSGSGAWTGLDLCTTAVISQIRYAPRTSNASRMIGGRFQGSTTADFSAGVVDLFTVSAPAPAYGVMTTAAVTNSTPFQYVRYLSPDNGYCNVAEIEFDGTLSPPSAPANVTANGTNRQISLTWSPAPTATSYNVKRANAANGPYVVIFGGVTGTSAVDTGLNNGTPLFYVLNARNAGGVSADSSPVSATPQMTYADFARQYGLGGANALNAAGITNLASYAFGLAPTGTAVGGLPTVTTDGSHLMITFTRRKAPTDVTYSVETSGDLLDWYAGPTYVTEQSAVSLDTMFETVTVQDNASMSVSVSRFLRVRLTLP